jgi:hypothetical protein
MDHHTGHSADARSRNLLVQHDIPDLVSAFSGHFKDNSKKPVNDGRADREN